MDWENVLIVHMLGGFSASWNEKKTQAGGKSADTQIVRLLQLLIHYRSEGVDKRMMMQTLDDDSKSEDVHHLLRTVIYNLRRKLSGSGLPVSEYITYRNGRYYWTDDIPVLEDTCRFEELYAKAEAETDPVERERLFLEACYTYTGEFLPDQMRLPWVSEENRRYSDIFEKCTLAAADILRQKGDYAGLERLGRHASKVSPFNEWESLTMEALIAQGKYREVQKLYASAVESYQKEMGVRFSVPVISRLETFADNIENRNTTPEDIHRQLAETEPESGGYYCTYPVFQGIYRIMKRYQPQIGKDTYLMVCTLTGHDQAVGVEEMLPDGKQTVILSERLRTAICRALEQNDIICRFARNQYLVILADRTAEECKLIRKKIDRGFAGSSSGARVEFDICPLAETWSGEGQECGTGCSA